MKITTTSSPARKLLDQVRDKIRFKHYSLSTENTYVSWIKQYILFNDKRYPAEMGTSQGGRSSFVVPSQAVAQLFSEMK